MEDVKSKTWIKNYVIMLINEVKDIPKKERETQEFVKRMVNKHRTFAGKFQHLMRLVINDGTDFDMITFNNYAESAYLFHFYLSFMEIYRDVFRYSTPR